jgi:hypothetical protein
MRRILAHARRASMRIGIVAHTPSPTRRKKARATDVARANVGYYPDYRFCTDT